ncbi:hypothetical protein, partial [Alkalibacterium gilvum]|uniref:hypothetical protein n=1 Tax=Alkalibacterium gilvum TaxID=1130080 RepID=UPI003F91AD00
RRSRNVWMRALQEKSDITKVTQTRNKCPPAQENNNEGHKPNQSQCSRKMRYASFFIHKT